MTWRKRLCKEKRFVQELKKAVDTYGFTGVEEKFIDICLLMGIGLAEDYNLQICARCGEADEDVELELVQDKDGSLYYAIYTDSVQAHRSMQHSYYNVEYKLPMNYLLSTVKEEEVINGICLNPYSGTPVIFTRPEISQILAFAN